MNRQLVPKLLAGCLLCCLLAVSGNARAHSAGPRPMGSGLRHSGLHAILNAPCLAISAQDAHSPMTLYHAHPSFHPNAGI